MGQYILVTDIAFCMTPSYYSTFQLIKPYLTQCHQVFHQPKYDGNIVIT